MMETAPIVMALMVIRFSRLFSRRVSRGAVSVARLLSQSTRAAAVAISKLAS